MAESIRIRFLGAAGTVTGSKYLIEAAGHRILVDCGLFQGVKPLRRRNWDAFPVSPKGIDAVVLTHGHLDHTGYLPRLVRQGYRGRVFATSGTADLLQVLLPDAAHLEEEHADYANRKGFSRHSPAQPLFTAQDAKDALARVDAFDYRKRIQLGDLPFWVTFYRAGHILGSSVVRLEIEGGPSIVFSGDLGRYGYPILTDPAVVPGADLVFVEATYGNRQHESREESTERLAQLVRESAQRGGVLLIPSFAVGRTQTLLYLLRELEDQGRIPRLPVYVDSPMASKVSRFYLEHAEDYDEDAQERTEQDRADLYPHAMHFVGSVDESKRLNSLRAAAIIISASGMMTGGRILHHAANRLPDPSNTMLFAGYQAEGTRGRDIINGAREVKMLGQLIPVRAKIERLEGLSAHGDADEILRWLATLDRTPRRCFCVHGEPGGLKVLSERIERDLGWSTQIPAYLEDVTLTPADWAPLTED